MEIKTFTLDDRGLQYLRGQLSGVNIFCEALLPLIDKGGEVFTWAPTDTSTDRLYQFEAGGLLPSNLDFSRAIDLGEDGKLMPVDTMGDEQAVMVQAELRGDSRRICIIDDVNPRWPEPVATREPFAFGVAEEVYHRLTSGATMKEILDTMYSARTLWHAMVAVCDEPLVIDDARTAKAEALRQTARSARAISCLAYDGEGYVAWRRT
jgi:hypothetical protein